LYTVVTANETRKPPPWPLLLHNFVS